MITATERAAHFAAKLHVETDPADVRAALAAGGPLVLVDTRDEAAWRQGRAAGAVHLPTATLADRAPAELPAGAPVVVYCWGPGCNGATKAALVLATLGYDVREMIGGFEYWVREGHPVETDAGREERRPDPLTAPTAGCSC